MLNIISIDYYLEDDSVTNIRFHGLETLMEADLVIIDTKPFVNEWKEAVSTYQDGTVKLQSRNSDTLRKHYARRKNDIQQLLDDGKVVFCFLDPIYKVQGQIRNGNNYSFISSYDFLPEIDCLKNLKEGNSTVSNLISLTNNGTFNKFYNTFKKELSYTAYFDTKTEDKEAFFLLNKAKKPVSALIKNGNGYIVLIPHIDHAFTNPKLITSLVDVYKKLTKKIEKTPTPDWVSEIKFKKEMKFISEKEKLDLKLEKILAQKQDIDFKHEQLDKYKTLLFETGKHLENIVLEAFNLFGFEAFNRIDGDIEHDLIFISEEGRGIAEVEGKNNNSIHIGKLDQLNRAVDEDFLSSEDYAQGVLIGNHFRLKEISKRGDPFTQKVKLAAERKNYGLLTTVEIFNAVKEILDSDKSTTELKNRIRKKILSIKGKEIKLTDK